MPDPEQRLDQLGKCVFLGMKNAFLIVFDTPSTCGGKLHSWTIGIHTLFSRMDRSVCMEVAP